MDVHLLGDMLRHFQTLPDPRRFNVTYTLAQWLTCTLLAVLCRRDDYEEIAGWVAARHDWLVEILGLPADRTPCRKTFERLFRRLNPKTLNRCFIELTQQLAQATQGRLIALPGDGKTLRGSFDHAHRSLPIHRVRIWPGCGCRCVCWNRFCPASARSIIAARTSNWGCEHENQTPARRRWPTETDDRLEYPYGDSSCSDHKDGQPANGALGPGTLYDSQGSFRSTII